MKYTIAFYNLENLFDYRNDIKTLDDDFLPNAEKQWTKRRYYRKIERVSRVISQIGKSSHETSPVIVGLAEVENKKVLHDLVNSKYLKQENYRYVHFSSLDERGIDVALLYNPEIFCLEKSESHKIKLLDENGKNDYTRDILSVRGIMNSEPICFIVNHWPSRREGIPISEPKRLIAAEKNKEIINHVLQEEPNTKVMVMGDFNDNPYNASLKFLEKELQLFNPMATLLSYTKGSLNYRGKWHLFDQILFSTNFFNTETDKLQFDGANIFDAPFLKYDKGRFKGQPVRTYVGDKYKNGYSDHFPVYVILTL
ncbi:MAG: endonuclease [Bacteroidota bacterium]